MTVITRELRDMFVDKKSIHVKLKPDIHASLRGKLFHYNLTMQDIFDGFAKLVAKDDKKAIKILEYLAQDKIENTILRAENKEKIKKEEHRQYYLSELEEEAMYNLIKGTQEDDDDQGSEEA